MARAPLTISIALSAVLAAAGFAWTLSERSQAARPAGRVVVVKMLDDGGKFRFEPAQVSVKRGDTVRFVQAGSMPHNVEFVRNTAPAGVDLRSGWVGPYLAARGETYEVRVDGRFADGTYDVLSHVTGPKDETGAPTVAGMVGIVQVDDGKTALIPPTEHRHH